MGLNFLEISGQDLTIAQTGNPAKLEMLVNPIVETSGGTSETAASIKTKYESNADTNAFTDDEKTKLSNTNENAEVNPDVVSQVDAEAGTDTDEKTWTAQRVKQAIEALASSSPEILDTLFRIVDSVSGYKHIIETSEQTADRTETKANFDFDFNDYFDGNGNILLNSASNGFKLGAANQVMLINESVNRHSFRAGNYIMGSVVKIGWSSSNLLSSTTVSPIDTTIERVAEGVVRFNDTIDLSNAGTYADDAAAGVGGVASGSVYINSATNQLTIKT